MPAAGPPAEVRDLGHGTYQLPTDYPDVCNAPLWTYLLAGTGRFGLVDPGVASTREATLTTAIQQAGFAPGQADVLLATHGHPDHSGGQGTWRGVAPAARIAAPLEDTAWVESFDKQWTRFWADYPGVMDLRDTRNFLAGLCRPEPRVDMLLRDGDGYRTAPWPRPAWPSGRRRHGPTRAWPAPGTAARVPSGRRAPGWR